MISKKIDYIVLFGHSNSKERISNIFIKRINLVIKKIKKYNCYNIIVTGGGKGNFKDSEAKIAYEIIKNEFSEINIFLEEKSTNTPENIINIKKWIMPNKNYLLISSFSHIKRCSLLFKEYFKIKPVLIFFHRFATLNKNERILYFKDLAVIKNGK